MVQCIWVKQVRVEGRVAAGIPRNLLKDCKMMSTNWQWNEHYNEIEGWKSDNGELEKERRERENSEENWCVKFCYRFPLPNDRIYGCFY